MKVMTVRAPDEMQEKLSRKSKEIGITRNALVLLILKQWLDREKMRMSDSDIGEDIEK